MSDQSRELVIGLLGMPDNQNTRRLMEVFLAQGLPIHFIVYLKPSLKHQCRRVLRKLRSSGVRSTLQRIVHALGSPLHGKPSSVTPPSCKTYFVRSHNGPECQKIIKDEHCDILVLATDSIINHAILAIPRLATLNAHPGWIPQFRGLGSTYFQLESGRLPAVSVHQADEGIDTGPLIWRECLDLDPRIGLKAIEDLIDRRQGELLVKVIKMCQGGKVTYIDTFTEPSNMTRGMSLRRKKSLDRRLQSGEITLRAFPSA